MRDSFVSLGVYHGPDARAWLSGTEVPILAIETGSFDSFQIAPADSPSEGYSEDHERFANELVAAAERYRDAIAGARLWADFDHGPPDAEGAI